MNKLCTTCNNLKPISRFGLDKHKPDGYRGQCKSCRAAIHRKSNREWAQNHPEQRKWHDRAKMLRQKYDMSIPDYTAMSMAQDHLCAICHKPESRPGYSLAVDHDHTKEREDGSVPKEALRGLLCNSCNRAIGMLEGNLTSAMRYLEKYRG